MPYIKQEQRQRFERALLELQNSITELSQVNPNEQYGILNYIITKLITDGLTPLFKYSQLNNLIGVLECAKLELYRRLGTEKEDAAIKENGDVIWWKETKS